ERLETIEVQLARFDRAGKRATIPGLLPAETDRQELGVGELEEPRRGRRVRPGQQPVERRARRGQGDLLLEDDVQQRRKPRFPVPKRRRTMPGDDGGEV